MTFADLVGYAATVVGTSVMVPQVVRILKTKKTNDLSLAMTSFYVANCVLWLTYGWLLKATPVMVANGIGLAIGIFQLALKMRYQHH
jgi:MtN3 and saliva related transmembrane protein